MSEREKITIREAARRGMPLGGADAQAMEHALTSAIEMRHALVRAIAEIMEQEADDAEECVNKIGEAIAAFIDEARKP